MNNHYIGTYVTCLLQVALPCTLFLAIAELDLNSINLVVIAVMSLAKIAVFLLGGLVVVMFYSESRSNKMRVTGAS